MTNMECIFCKIVKGDIPSEKILETENIFAFMDINPLAPGHALFIPKEHAVKAHEVSDAALKEILVAIKKVSKIMELENYNVLQNNGSLAHQAVKHAHWHLIPKPNRDKGLIIQWRPLDGVNQAPLAEKIRENM